MVDLGGDRGVFDRGVIREQKRLAQHQAENGVVVEGEEQLVGLAVAGGNNAEVLVVR